MGLIPNMSPLFHFFDKWINYIYQLDIVFGLLIVIIALLLAVYSYKVYNFTNKRNYLLFCLSFLFIALGYAVKTCFDALVNFESMHKEIIMGIFNFPPLYIMSLFAFMILTIIGFIIMAVIAMKGNRITALLLLLLLLVSLLMSRNYFISFILTVITLIAFLVYHFFRNFEETRNINAGLVWFSFVLIFLSYIVFIFMYFSNKFYLLSNLLLMAGFGLLLINYMLVLRK